MLTTTHKRTPLFVALLASVLLTAALALWSQPVPPAQALSRRPTLTPTATSLIPSPTPLLPTATPVPPPAPGNGASTPAGGTVRLQAQFPPQWPWLDVPWQDVWTGVQWQAPGGEWHDVETWQGTLDQVVVDAEGLVAGQKTWWVAQPDLGTGPFRWRATHGPGGKLLAESDPFYLPARVGEWVEVYVELAW